MNLTKVTTATQPARRSSLIPEGKIVKEILPGNPALTYYVYVPRGCRPEDPLVLSIHGISRNAREHCELFLSCADHYRTILVAPLFERDSFCDYQRMGLKKGCSRADHYLLALIDEVKKRTGNRSRKVHLFGYSGGAQFAHRFTMAYPELVEKAAVAAAGWYTFPDPTLEYPLGIKPTLSLPGVLMQAARFLSVPVSVFVGELDSVQDDDLRKSPSLTHQQGLTRIERGIRWTKVMAAASRSYNQRALYDFSVVPGSGHSFAECMEKGNMGLHVYRSFFDSREASDQNRHNNQKERGMAS